MIGRIDFTRYMVYNETTGQYDIISTPNWERYEIKEIPIMGKLTKVIYDKFNMINFTEDDFEKMFEQSKRMKAHYAISEIKNPSKYITSRQERIENFLNGKKVKEEIKPHSLDFLSKHIGEEKLFVILSIDLKGSTKMSQEMPIDVNADIVELFSNEMGLIVHKTNGYILKYTGDGLIAFFPEPNFIGMHDMALYCARVMKKMVIEGINPALKRKGHPELSIKIGLDSGKAIIKNIGIPGIKTQEDLIGETVNLAKKIEGLADNNQILLGNSVAILSHTNWRKNMSKVSVPDDWIYKDAETGKSYEMYLLDV